MEQMQVLATGADAADAASGCGIPIDRWALGGGGGRIPLQTRRGGRTPSCLRTMMAQKNFGYVDGQGAKIQAKNVQKSPIFSENSSKNAHF